MRRKRTAGESRAKRIPRIVRCSFACLNALLQLLFRWIPALHTFDSPFAPTKCRFGISVNRLQITRHLTQTHSVMCVVWQTHERKNQHQPGKNASSAAYWLFWKTYFLPIYRQRPTSTIMAVLLHIKQICEDPFMVFCTLWQMQI